MLKAICSGKDLSSTSFYDCVSDIISCPELSRLKGITHHICTTRFQHSLNVSYYSYVVCRFLRLDARSAARAGLLHDLFYYDRKTYNASRSKGQPSHSSMHAAVALKNACAVTDISKLERDIIAKHMWPVTRPVPKYRETYVITVIDKYCAILEFCVPQLKKASPARIVTLIGTKSSRRM
ncbi:MAG: HAD family hydrolase [Ruminococcus sp.]|nr:HAD family hydrolase [Ruminococcus sp.]